MSDKRSRILITSALPYINGVKHLGNLAGSMLPADVYARVMRLLGYDVLYVCATDEHGTPAELAAAEAGLSVKAYCDQMYEKQKEAGEAFDLSYDWFGRSSSQATAELTQHFSAVLERNGLIEARTSKQVYSNADGRYLPDRYVEGTCPNCGYEKARGDQCDNCGKLLDPVDLINPYSAVSGSKDVEIRETEHLYLKQSAMSDQLRDWVNQQTSWPPLATSIALKWLDEGLRDRSITRDLDWGIPVVDADGNPRAGLTARSTMSGLTLRSPISGQPRTGRVRLAATGNPGGGLMKGLMTSPMFNSWAKIMWPSIRCRSRRL